MTRVNTSNLNFNNNRFRQNKLAKLTIQQPVSFVKLVPVLKRLPAAHIQPLCCRWPVDFLNEKMSTMNDPKFEFL